MKGCGPQNPRNLFRGVCQETEEKQDLYVITNMVMRILNREYVGRPITESTIIEMNKLASGILNQFIETGITGTYWNAIKIVQSQKDPSSFNVVLYPQRSLLNDNLVCTVADDTEDWAGKMQEWADQEQSKAAAMEWIDGCKSDMEKDRIRG